MRVWFPFWGLVFCVNLLHGQGALEREKRNYVLKTINEAISKGDSLKLAEAYYLLGKYETGIGNIYTGKAWYTKSLAILKRFPERYETGRGYLRMAMAEIELKKTESAKAYADSASKVFKRIGSAKGIISVYMFMAGPKSKEDTAKLKSHFDEQEFNEMVSMAKNKKLVSELGYLYQTRGDILLQKQPAVALEAFEIAKKWFLDNGQHTQIDFINLDIVLASVRLNQLGHARQIFDELNFKVNKNGEPTFWANYEFYYRVKIELLEAEKKWEEALNVYKDYDAYIKKNQASEKVFLEQQSAYLEKLAASNNSEKELILQAEKLKEIELRNLTAIALLVMLGFLGTSFYLQSKKNKRLYDKYQKISDKNELLIKEQSHRVKNNLQVISSLIGLQINRLDDFELKASLEETQGRIAVMSLLQQVLYENDNINDIHIEEFFRLITEKNHNIFNLFPQGTFKITDEYINPDIAIHLGIIYNELLTNSFKYAFGFDNPNPQITLTAKKVGPMYSFQYSDNGSNPDLLVFDEEYFGRSQTFGLSLIRLKSKELNGKYTFYYNNGLHFKLEFDYAKAQSFDRRR